MNCSQLRLLSLVCHYCQHYHDSYHRYHCCHYSWCYNNNNYYYYHYYYILAQPSTTTTSTAAATSTATTTVTTTILPVLPVSYLCGLRLHASLHDSKKCWLVHTRKSSLLEPSLAEADPHCMRPVLPRKCRALRRPVSLECVRGAGFCMGVVRV